MQTTTKQFSNVRTEPNKNRLAGSHSFLFLFATSVLALNGCTRSPASRLETEFKDLHRDLDEIGHRDYSKGVISVAITSESSWAWIAVWSLANIKVRDIMDGRGGIPPSYSGGSVEVSARLPRSVTILRSAREIHAFFSDGDRANSLSESEIAEVDTLYKKNLPIIEADCDRIKAAIRSDPSRYRVPACAVWTGSAPEGVFNATNSSIGTNSGLAQSAESMVGVEGGKLVVRSKWLLESGSEDILELVKVDIAKWTTDARAAKQQKTQPARVMAKGQAEGDWKTVMEIKITIGKNASPKNFDSDRAELLYNGFTTGEHDIIGRRLVSVSGLPGPRNYEYVRIGTADLPRRTLELFYRVKVFNIENVRRQVFPSRTIDELLRE